MRRIESFLKTRIYASNKRNLSPKLGLPTENCGAKVTAQAQSAPFGLSAAPGCGPVRSIMGIRRVESGRGDFADVRQTAALIP
jgi:hypothetical protein